MNVYDPTKIPLYLGHKKVRALKIKSVTDAGTDTTTDENPIVVIEFEDSSFPPDRVNLRGKPTPAAGWYLVFYEDVYTSFSPTKAFEEGYTKSPTGTADLSTFTESALLNWFTYHSSTPEQLGQYQEVREAARVFAVTLNRLVPGGADKTAAMRKLRECVMTANAAIACASGVNS